MAEVNPPGFLQNAGATHTGEQMRNWFGNNVGGSQASGSLIARGGVVATRGNVLAVTQTGSPSMAVIIRSGEAFIPGSEGSKQGVYAVLNDADVTLSVTAAHATLNRIDIVCYKVQDTAYSGAVNSSSLVVVAGTPAASPAVPTAPANSITLAQIAVNAAVTSITNANITDTRIYVIGNGGVALIRNSGARPASGTVQAGTWFWNIGTSKFEFTDGSGVFDGMPLYKTRQTLGAPTATVTFSSIPTNLRSLRLVYRATTAAGAGSNVQLQVNGNVGSNYTFHNCGSTDAGDITPSGATSTAAFIGVIAGGGSAHMGSAEVTFSGWDQAGVLAWHFQSFAWDTVLFTRYGGGIFNVAGPYTSLTLTVAGAANFTTGSDFSLEGVYA
jgi:hypothetical protein